MDSSVSRRNGSSEKNGKSASNTVKPSGNSSHNEVDDECSRFSGFIQRSFLPIFLMLFTPNLAVFMWYTVARCDGSILVLIEHLTRDGLYKGVMSIWLNINIASPLAVGVLLGYISWSLLLMVLVPGPKAEGPVTPSGHVPVYRDNGFSCYLITMAAFTFLQWYLKSFTKYSVTVVYDKFDEFIGTLTVFSHVLCLVLNIKGLTFPSTPDSGSSGNLIFDYYWGTELYPRIFGIDIKVFTNCRFGMTVWPLLVMIYTIKNYELYGFVDGAWVSCLLQMVYFTKFFWWEAGYMRTIDIMVDRAGFYICWGCLCFVPGIYASVSMYLAEHAKLLGTPLSLCILIAGLVSCVVNYAADRQKLVVRNTNGNCTVWGQRPEVIRAEYKLETGETRTSLLLVSGYWGIARHFHYIPELALALLWTLPALFNHLTPYTYFITLLCILTHRTFRDDIKCAKKYGKDWISYCKRVPYKMIPYVF